MGGTLDRWAWKPVSGVWGAGRSGAGQEEAVTRLMPSAVRSYSGRANSAPQIASASTKQYGKALCMDCAKAAKDAQTEAADGQ